MLPLDMDHSPISSNVPRFFLQRLSDYTTVPLTPAMTELLGKIMAQVLSILALSTKAMKDRRISACVRLTSSFVADYGTEKFIKRLIGKTEVEDALTRLDALTKEENLLTAARILAVTHHVDDNVQVIRRRARRSFNFFILVPTFPVKCRTDMDEQQRSLLHDDALFILTIETYLQAISHERCFGHGSILRILPSITVQRTTLNTTAQRRVSSNVADSMSGKRMVRYCGSVEIVRFSCPTASRH